MKGECRHHLLAEARPTAVLPARTEGVLIDLGPYPAMVEGAGVVLGEYVEFERLGTLLPILDRVEGTAYRRVVVPVQLPGGEVRGAWAYVWQGDPAAGSRIVGGSWRERGGAR